MNQTLSFPAAFICFLSLPAQVLLGAYHENRR
jgi:hypothetical protein